MPQRHFGGCAQADDETAQCTCEVDGIYCRCIVCREQFPLNQVVGQSRCPQCGTAFKPMSPLDDVVVKVNWWELQIITSWAEAWANQNALQTPHMRTVVYATAKDLEDQCPQYNALTVAGDHARMRSEQPAPTNIGSEEVNLNALLTRPVVH